MAKNRKQMWVDVEFAEFVKRKARKEKELLRLPKTPSTVDITYKLIQEMKEKDGKVKLRMFK